MKAESALKWVLSKHNLTLDSCDFDYAVTIVGNELVKRFPNRLNIVKSLRSKINSDPEKERFNDKLIAMQLYATSKLFDNNEYKYNQNTESIRKICLNTMSRYQALILDAIYNYNEASVEKIASVECLLEAFYIPDVGVKDETD